MNFSVRFRLDVAYTIKIGNIYFDLMGDVIIDIILASFIPFVIVLQLCKSFVDPGESSFGPDEPLI